MRWMAAEQRSGGDGVMRSVAGLPPMARALPVESALERAEIGRAAHKNSAMRVYRWIAPTRI